VTAAAEYLKRLGPYASLETIEVADVDLAPGEERARRMEGESLAKALPADAYVIALDSEGLQYSSEEFSRHLAEMMHSGLSSVAFVIGGSAGLDRSAARPGS